MFKNFAIIEDWWRHQGCYDRAQASGIPYDEDTVFYEFLQKTDDWWESLSLEQKKKAYDDFFSEI